MWSSRQACQAGQRTTRATGKAPRLVLEGDLLARLLGLVAHQGLGFRAHSPELPATACVHAYARATLNRPCEARSAGEPSYDWGGAAPTKRLFPLRHGIPCGMVSHGYSLRHGIDTMHQSGPHSPNAWFSSRMIASSISISRSLFCASAHRTGTAAHSDSSRALRAPILRLCTSHRNRRTQRLVTCASRAAACSIHGVERPGCGSAPWRRASWMSLDSHFSSRPVTCRRLSLRAAFSSLRT